LLVGQDPTQVVALSEDITNRLPWNGGPVFGTAVAAINMALYDIAGKAWGVPVHTILGGKRRDRVRVYSNGGTFASPDEAVKCAQAVVDAGYAGVKANPLETRTWPRDEEAVALSVACVAAIREAMGPHFDILLDTHGSPSVELALAFAHRVAPYRPLFLEEPVKVGSTDALIEVSRKSPVPIATGEKLFSSSDFQPLIDQRACAYLQPDVTHCFGITTLLGIAQHAERNQMLMAPHNVGGPIAHAATLHADAAMNNFLIQETTAVFFDQYDGFAEHDWKIEGGYINISDAPGLGVLVKEADLAKMPYEPLPYRQYRHADGSWKGW
jgi:galactonate dehydratase